VTGHDGGSPYWSATIQELLDRVSSTPRGLTSEEARRRLVSFGPNALRVRRRATGLVLFLRQFKSAIVLILLFATAVSAALQDWVTAAIILAIVLGSALLSFTQEYHASAATEKLQERLTVKSRVLRDGNAVLIPSEDIVPGDVVLLSAGSIVPADGVLLELRDFFVSESSLTGETFPVEKKLGPVAVDAALPARTGSVFMGTNVRSGAAQALVVETGARTVYGQIARHLELREPENDFQRGIRHFSYLLTEVMLVLTIIVFAVNVLSHKPVLDSLLFSVALAVGITPQLLPAIVSVNLARGSQVMAHRGVLVRRLESIENLGSMDVLCTDKTGTLTEGIVKLEQTTDVDGKPSARVLSLAGMNARLQTGLPNPLDEAIKEADHEPAEGTKVDEVPYDFVRKRLSVVADLGGGRLLITKGAVENVLGVSTAAGRADAVVPLDPDTLEAVRERVRGWSAQGLRVIAVASRKVPLQERYERGDERDLILEGFLTFFDPPKSGVSNTIADLAGLGVRLKIITGDNRLVAAHTAEAVGLPVTGIVTGAALDRMADEALRHAADSSNLFVEIDPNQKERVILALKRTGHVVGYMGDGINDAPALLAADAGISVDQAVDVAKQAADFVLMERDLAVLHEGVVLGRRTFANTLKYIFITTSASFGNIFSMAGASLFLPFLPMMPAQVLLTNFLTDLPAMAIAGDGVDKEQITGPRRWNVRAIRNFMIVFGAESSVFDYATFGLLLLVFHATAQPFRTAWFVESVLTEIAVLFILRTRRFLFRSRPSTLLTIGALGVAAVALAIPFTPLGAVLQLVPLPRPLLLTLLGITVVYVAATELTKKLFFRSQAA